MFPSNYRIRNYEDYYISSFEKIAIATMFFLHFCFFGVLTFNVHYNVPFSSYISGSMNMSCFLIAIGLLFKDISYSKFPRFTPAIICLFLFLLYFVIVFILDKEVGYEKSDGLSRGKIFNAYALFVIYTAPFFMFFAGRNRLAYILSNPWLVYIPSLFSTIVILLINRTALSTFSLEAAYATIDTSGLTGGHMRYIIRQPPIFLIVVSVYFMFFDRSKWNNFLWGPIGCGFAILSALITDSRSTFMAFAFILGYYGIVSMKTPSSFVYATVVYVVGAIVTVPALLVSKVYERMIDMGNISDYELVDATRFGRLGLIQVGFSQFLESPIIGGSIYLKGAALKGSWSHCTPITILYSTGLIGASLLLVTACGAIRGIPKLRLLFGERAFWIYALFIAEVVEMLCHGNTTHLFCSGLATFLVADALTRNRY